LEKVLVLSDGEASAALAGVSVGGWLGLITGSTGMFMA
jgi:hypothetical protein